MGILVERIRLLSACADELVRFGLPEVTGPVDREVLFLVDGVGGFQAAPLMVRRALRKEGVTLGTVLFVWQYGLVGEVWTDLMWLRRNRVMGARLARKLLAFRRAHPRTVIHLVAFSGGAGIAVFACERLRGRRIIDTLILACPALSPAYNLGPALQEVHRCYALVSERDILILGLGTRIFGTIDRRFLASAGKVGFCIPGGIPPQNLRAYQRLLEVPWSPSFTRDGHYGGHTSWAGETFLRRHLPGMLRGEPDLPVRKVQPV
jgi:hypothetical protein